MAIIIVSVSKRILSALHTHHHGFISGQSLIDKILFEVSLHPCERYTHGVLIRWRILV